MHKLCYSVLYVHVTRTVVKMTDELMMGCRCLRTLKLAEEVALAEEEIILQENRAKCQQVLARKGFSPNVNWLVDLSINTNQIVAENN